MKPFVKYFSLAAGIAALLAVAAPVADAAWTAFTQTGARTSILNNASGHFEIGSDNFIYALGQNGAIYRYNRDIYNNPIGGSWEGVTSDGGIDVFKRTVDGKYYILGGNGAVYHYSGGAWVQVTKDGARSTANFGKSGHFDIVDGFIYALGGDGAVYKWSIGLSDPDIASKISSGSWDMATAAGGNDVFKKIGGIYYILGGNGAVYQYSGGSWVQITKDGARSSAKDGKSGNFEIVDNFIYALGGDGAIYKWSKSINETPDPNGGSWGSAITSAGGTDVFKKGPLTDKPWYILGQDGAVYYEGGGDTIAPSTPANVAATTISSTQIDLSWDPSSDNTAVTGYIIYRNSNVLLEMDAPSPDTAHNYPNTGLTPSTTYTYTVAARDAAGNISAQSQSVSATTLGAGGTSAPAITSLSPTSATVGSLVTISGSNFISPANTNTVNFGSIAVSGISVNTAVTPQTLTFSVPSVTAGTYNVSVTNANGTSTTQTFTVTTLGATGLIVTLTPTPTSVNPNETITVTWTVNQGTPQVNDWIGLFQSGAGNTSYLTFQYATGASTGTLTFSAPATPGSYQFRYLPRNSYVDVGRSTTVLVQGDVTTAPALTFTANPVTISAGQSSTLTWSATNTTSCTASGGTSGWAGTKSASGSSVVSPTATTGFDLSCTGAGGTVTKSIDIVLTPTASIQQCDTSAAAAKIAQATAQLSACIAGDAAACALSSALLLEATTLLSSCGTVSPPGVSPPGSQLYDGLAVKANAALYVRSSPEISSTNKLNANRPLPVGATGTIDCSSPENLAAGVTAPTPENCGVLANGFIWWYVKWDLYDDGYSAEQAPGFTGLIIPATGGSGGNGESDDTGGDTGGDGGSNGGGSVTLSMDPDGPNGPALPATGTVISKLALDGFAAVSPYIAYLQWSSSASSCVLTESIQQNFPLIAYYPLTVEPVTFTFSDLPGSGIAKIGIPTKGVYPSGGGVHDATSFVSLDPLFTINCGGTTASLTATHSAIPYDFPNVGISEEQFVNEGGYIAYGYGDSASISGDETVRADIKGAQSGGGFGGKQQIPFVFTDGAAAKLDYDSSNGASSYYFLSSAINASKCTLPFYAPTSNAVNGFAPAGYEFNYSVYGYIPSSPVTLNCENGTGASHIDAISLAGTVSTNTNSDAFRRGLAQVAAGVAEVTKSIEQLLKNLGR